MYCKNNKEILPYKITSLFVKYYKPFSNTYICTINILTNFTFSKGKNSLSNIKAKDICVYISLYLQRTSLSIFQEHFLIKAKWPSVETPIWYADESVDYHWEKQNHQSENMKRCVLTYSTTVGSRYNAAVGGQI